LNRLLLPAAGRITANLATAADSLARAGTVSNPSLWRLAGGRQDGWRCKAQTRSTRCLSLRQASEELVDDSVLKLPNRALWYLGEIGENLDLLADARMLCPA